MPFIEKLLEHTQIYESPTSFWYWSAVTTIAAVLRDNVWIDEGRYKVWPNIYTMFLAGSGGRKDRPVKMSMEMVRHIGNTKSISGRASIQAILDELSRTETDHKTGKVKSAGCAIWFAPELAAGLVADEAAISVLTNIYDGETDFKSILRHGTSFKIERIVFSSFTATNEKMMRSFFDAKAIYGGLLSRTLLITEGGEFRPAKDLFTTEAEKVEQDKEFKELLKELEIIANFTGPVYFSKDAQAEFSSWYKSFRENYLKSGDQAGVAGRLHTTAKKISLILAMNDQSKIIQKCHMEHAIDSCVKLLPNYKLLALSGGKSEVADAGALLLKILYSSQGFGLTEKEILRNHWQEIDSSKLSELITTLSAAGIIRNELKNGQICYTLTKEFLEKMK